jgi:hypothetical protein
MPSWTAERFKSIGKLAAIVMTAARPPMLALAQFGRDSGYEDLATPHDPSPEAAGADQASPLAR